MAESEYQTAAEQRVGTGWEPANEVERMLRTSLEQRDGQEYVRLLMSSQVYLAELPEYDSEAWGRLEEKLPVDREHILAFTSPETLAWALGDCVNGYETFDFADVLDGWPGEECHLAVNPCTPIAVYLPITAIHQLAEGEGYLAAGNDVAEAFHEHVLVNIRRICLAELSGKSADGGAADAAGQDTRDDPPGNDLEAELHAALDAQDGAAFVLALVGGDVVVPTMAEVITPGLIEEDSFPWLRVDAAGLTAVPLFSSTAAMDRLMPSHSPRVRLPFIDVMANWPGTDHALCFNPGSTTELILPGEAIPELGHTILDAIDPQAK